MHNMFLKDYFSRVGILDHQEPIRTPTLTLTLINILHHIKISSNTLCCSSMLYFKLLLLHHTPLQQQLIIYLKKKINEIL